MPPLISVVICTYNRAAIFKNALQSVCAQTIDPSSYEVIVVDNNSTDQTAEIAQSFCQQFPHVHYIKEKQQGLSYARNTGWQKAKGAYIAYIDDDCEVPETWLAVALNVIEQQTRTL